MGQRHEDFHDLPPSEALRVGRSNRVQHAEELAWKTLLTYGDPQNGYRFPPERDGGDHLQAAGRLRRLSTEVSQRTLHT